MEKSRGSYDGKNTELIGQGEKQNSANETELSFEERGRWAIVRIRISAGRRHRFPLHLFSLHDQRLHLHNLNRGLGVGMCAVLQVRHLDVLQSRPLDFPNRIRVTHHMPDQPVLGQPLKTAVVAAAPGAGD